MTRITPSRAGGAEVCAFLDMIAWAEGTDNGRQPTRDRGYDVLVGGALFDSYRDHPRVLVPLPRYGIKSSAAGRYQLLGRYFDHYKALLRLRDFGPLSQDLIAIQQIREQRALPLIQAGQFEHAVAQVANIWASLPGAGYGQHEQRMDRLRSVYDQALAGVAP